MVTSHVNEPVVGPLRLREGHLKEPIEGVVVYLLLDRVAAQMTVTPPNVLGTLEALALWAVAVYTAVALYQASQTPESSGDNSALETLPDRALAVGLAGGGIIGMAMVWTKGVSVWAAWMTAIELGPGSGVPTDAGGGNPIVWIFIAIIAMEALTRGLDKLAVRYVWTGGI